MEALNIAIIRNKPIRFRLLVLFLSLFFSAPSYKRGWDGNWPQWWKAPAPNKQLE